MLLRSVLLFGLASGLCLAGSPDSMGDPLRDAIQRAIPSPFAVQAGMTASKVTKPFLNQLLSQPSAKELVQQAAHVCAIPLTNVPVSTSKDYAVRGYDISKTHVDEMAKTPAAAACPSK